VFKVPADTGLVSSTAAIVILTDQRKHKYGQ
jgi:hypothetical protein